MIRNVNLSEEQYFLPKYFFNEKIRFYALTGGRGCGKTESVRKLSQKFFNQNKKVLFIRNSPHQLSSARQYFSFLCSDNEEIQLGSMGASSIVLFDSDTKEKSLIGYTLYLGDYDSFKSSKKEVDYIIYEEFSTFDRVFSFNRIFSLVEIFETIAQYNRNFYFFAISNNLFNDDLLENIFPENEFIHFFITKKNNKNAFSNNTIKKYLNGEILVPEMEMNLSEYNCIGFLDIAETKVYIFRNVKMYPSTILSSKGTGKEVGLNYSLVSILKSAVYKSLKDRNFLEFAVGLVTFAQGKLKI